VVLLLSLFLAAQPIVDPARTADSAGITLVFGGDCMFAGAYAADVGTDMDRAFSALPMLKEADLAVINLEGPLTLRGEKVPKPFNFRMPPATTRILTGAGVDVACIANNHVFDYGPDGLFDTISYLDSAGIAHVGAGRNEREAYAPAVFALGGVKVGLLAFYGGGEAPGAIGSTPGVARRELPRIRRSITALRDSVDYLIVVLHWGTEKEILPDPGQQSLARSIIDAGADAVIGHHPHVLQGIEVYGKGVIAYSLGNFIFGGNSRSTYDTGLLEIRLGGGSTVGDRSRERTVGYRFVPVRVDRWRAQELSGKDADRVNGLVRERSAPLRYNMFNSHGITKESP
jgi:poly-gamma-glutamate capsule biosynthesis protein CapA/YwtB (metallophosphatase superfamily)